MNGGRIDTRGAVGQRDIAAAGILGDSDQIGHAPERSVGAGRGCPDDQSTGQVSLACADHLTLPDRLRQAFPGDQRTVDLASALDDDPVDRTARTRQQTDFIVDLQIGYSGYLSVRAQGSGHFKRGQFRRRRASRQPGALIEIASGQKEEGQRECGVEIGVLTAGRGLEKGHPRGQEDRQRYRHVHVQATAL